MPHSTRKLLLDIKISCDEIAEFTKDKACGDFQKDRILQLAIERKFEIIGEALNRLHRIDTERVEDKIPEYHKIIGFRNLLAHGYDIIDEDSLWDFVRNKVPELLSKSRLTKPRRRWSERLSLTLVPSLT